MSEEKTGQDDKGRNADVADVNDKLGSIEGQVELAQKAESLQAIKALMDAVIYRADVTEHRPRIRPLHPQLLYWVAGCFKNIRHEHEKIDKAFGLTSGKRGRPTVGSKMVQDEAWWAWHVGQMISEGISREDAVNAVAANAFKSPRVIESAYDRRKKPAPK